MSSVFGRMRRLARLEISDVPWRLVFAQAILKPIPVFAGSRIRTAVLRKAGVQIGPGTVFWGTPKIRGGRDAARNLRFGTGCWINEGCLFDASAPITIGDRVAIGHQVMILTNGHRMGNRSRRAGTLKSESVVVENGSWLSSRCIILPGITVATGAVVAAGAVVAHDVEDDALVGGVPAEVRRTLTEEIPSNT